MPRHGLAPLLSVALLLGACESDRYRWNLTHAYAVPQTHLSRADFAQIVRTVTHACVDPIGQVEPLPSVAGHRRVSVDAESPTGPVTFFVLEQSAGSWHIIDHEQSLDR